jgi:5-methyltetrahydrofolate--homocysteine methyltransferase
MGRRGLRVPLLIGGATTSPAHTALKIDPHYAGPVVYVKDASRAVGVCQQLVTPQSREAYVSKIKADHALRREQHAAKKGKSALLMLKAARDRRAPCDWSSYQPPVPRFLGRRAFEQVPLRELVPFVDWMPFFNAWEFTGTFPAILDDPQRGAAAQSLYADARAMLDQLVREQWLQARAVVGFFAANTDGDDIEVYTDNSRRHSRGRLHHLRQQKAKPADKPQRCLADFIAPRESGVADYVGAFAVTAGIGIEAQLERFAAAHDDYSGIMLKSLADRLAEACAEALHLRVRRELWAYAPDERLTNEQLIAEKFRGIRPAPGYPACPDHTEKATLWQLLDVERLSGIRLTESYAMYPTAAVSGWYFSHPQAQYFGVGPVGLDQVHDYAVRKGMSVAEVERWLAPNLSYDPRPTLLAQTA